MITGFPAAVPLGLIKQLLKKSILLFSVSLLVACAGQNMRLPAYHLQDVASLPATDPSLEHVIAWIPLEQAQTAAVAEAMTHIALRAAHDRVSRDLCRQRVSRSAQVLERHGPVATEQPAVRGGGPAWYYRISLAPGHSGCRDVQPAAYNRTLATRLPEWLILEPPAIRQAAERVASDPRG